MPFLIVQYNGNNNRGDEKSDKTKNTFILFSFFVKHYIMLLITIHLLLYLSLSFKLVPGSG